MTDALDIVGPIDLFALKETDDIRQVEYIRDDGEHAPLEDESLDGLIEATNNYKAAKDDGETGAEFVAALGLTLVAIQRIDRNPWPKQLRWVVRKDFPGNFSELLIEAQDGVTNPARAEELRQRAAAAIMCIRLEGAKDPESGAGAYPIRGATLQDRMREISRLPEPYWRYPAVKVLEKFYSDPLGLKAVSMNGSGGRGSKRTSRPPKDATPSPAQTSESS